MHQQMDFWFAIYISSCQLLILLLRFTQFQVFKRPRLFNASFSDIFFWTTAGGGGGIYTPKAPRLS